jgi:hypothetical protein
MTTNLPSRAQVDAAPPLEFKERAARQDLTITVKARIDGFDTEICYTGSIDQLLAVTKRLRDLGGETTIAPVHTAPLNGAKPKASSVTYDGDGTPLCGNANCSRYGKPLEPSQHNGYFCKGKDERTGNAKGYCRSTAEK